MLRSADDPFSGVPQRISYLIDPGGVVVKAYDLAGQDLSEHAAVVLADIAELSD